MSIFGAAFDTTSPPFLLALVLLRSKQCFGFAQANQMTENHISSSGCGPDWSPHKIDNFLTGRCKNKKAFYTLYITLYPKMQFKNFVCVLDSPFRMRQPVLRCLHFPLTSFSADRIEFVQKLFTSLHNTGIFHIR